MIINEFFDKYFCHIKEHFTVIETSFNDLSNIPNKFHYLIINDIPDNQYDVFNIISPLFLKLSNGCSLFINDINCDINQYFNDVITGIREDSTNGIQGVAITHIIGVGYIITALHRSGQMLYNEYTEEEYDKLSNQCVVVGLAKQEAHYIRDWVAYHLHIGFDRVMLFDNNDIDGEEYSDILSDFIDSGKLDIVNVRGKKAIQCSIYNSFLFSVPFKWCAFIDIDEFIWFNETGPYTNIKDFMDSVEQPDSFGILLQWHCYKGTGDDKPSDLHIWDACNEPVNFNARKDSRCEYINDWCKSIYRKGYPVSCNEHFGWFDGLSGSPHYLYQVSCGGQPIRKVDFTFINEKDFNNQSVYVKHFLLRNINEFYYKKYMRGHAGLLGVEGQDGWAYYQWRQNMNYYTDITPVLTDKEQLFMAKLGMKVNYTFHPDVIVNFHINTKNTHLNNRVIRYLSSQVLPNTNTLFNLISICSNSAITLDRPENTEGPDGSVDFITNYINSTQYLGINMMDDSASVRKFIQDPIIINIGFPWHWTYIPVSVKEQDDYLRHIECMLNWNNLKSIIRQALQYNRTTFLKVGDIYTDNNFGWQSTLKPFMEELGFNLLNHAITNNTFVMPYQTYQKYKEFQKRFTDRFGFVDNDFIIDNAKCGLTTAYHAFISSFPSIIDNPYYIWPS